MTGPSPGAGNGKPLAKAPIVVIIRTDWTGRIVVSVQGPIKGRAGLLALLDAARQIAEQMDEP